MNEIEKKYATYSNNKATPHKFEHRKGQKDPQTAVTDLMKKLNMWREDSQSQFMSILNCYTNSIYMGINNLMEEVCDLQDQLAATAKERNDLIDLLNGEIKHQIDKSPLRKPIDDSNEHTEDNSEVENQDTERTQTNSNTGDKKDQRDYKNDADHKFEDKQDKYPLGDMDLLNVLTLSELTHAGLHNIELVAADDKVINNIEIVAEDDNVVKGKNDEMNLDQEEAAQINQMEGTISPKKTVKSEDHVCSQCNYAFSTNANLINHLKSMHLNSEPSEQRSFPRILRAKEVNPSEKNKFNGQGNNQSEAAMKQETGNNHEVQLKQQWFSFVNKGETKFRCGHCPYTSGKKCDIERHGEEVHSYVGDLICRVCGYAASQKSALKTHIERVHEKIRKYVCQDCGYATSEKKSLLKHIDVLHDKLRNYTCDQCDYATSQSHHLKDHILSVHKQCLRTDGIGSAIFYCEKCSYSSKVSSHVKSHVKRVHKNINKDDKDKAGRVIQVIKLSAPK